MLAAILDRCPANTRSARVTPPIFARSLVALPTPPSRVTRTRARDRASGRLRVRALSCALLAAACALAAGCAPAALSFGGLARAAAPPAPPPLRIQVEERYYTVSGRSASALNQALVLSGPRGVAGWRTRSPNGGSGGATFPSGERPAV